MNIYEPKTMTKMVDTLPPLHTFLKSTFFRTNNCFPTDVVKFDIVKNGMPMAPFVSPRIGNTVLEREGMETVQFEPPLVAPMRPLTMDDMNVRIAGEPQVNGYHPNKRRAHLLRKDMKELERSITRREEWMAAQALFNGKIIMVGQGVNKQIDFGFENNIVVDVPWDDETNSDPMMDLLRARKKASLSGYSPDVAIADSDTINNLLNNERVQKFFDNTGFSVGVIQPHILENGATYYGFLRQAGLHIYSYDGQFADNDNENPDNPGVAPGDAGFKARVYNLIPKGKVFVGSTKMPAEMLYAVLGNPTIGAIVKPRATHSWTNDKGTVRSVEVTSKPLACPKDVSAWVLLDVA